MATNSAEEFHFPSGDEKDYPDHKTWSLKRIAWEILRRTPDFIEDCKLLRDASITPASHCRKWQLRTPKTYAEEYTVGEKPRFKLPIRMFWRLPKEGHRKLRLSINSREFVCVFKIDSPQGAQLAMVRKLFATLQGNTRKRAAVKKAWPDRIAKMIRAYDAREAALTWKDVAAVISPKKDLDSGMLAPTEK